MRPKLDHHIGKTVESVDTEKAVWNIRLEDGTVITSRKKSPKPPVEELKLMVVQRFKSKDSTVYKMHFGKPNKVEEVIEVECGKYEINGIDPHEEIPSDIPPDPSPERIQDQPEGGWKGKDGTEG